METLKASSLRSLAQRKWIVYVHLPALAHDSPPTRNQWRPCDMDMVNHRTRTGQEAERQSAPPPPLAPSSLSLRVPTSLFAVHTSYCWTLSPYSGPSAYLALLS